MQEKPLILTLKIDEESQAFFDVQRTRYFPPERNYLAAHLTLFHQLPQTVKQELQAFNFKTFELQVSGLMNLGAGVAYRIESAELMTLHQALREKFKDFLIPQDRQAFRPHVTIMNKTTPEKATALITTLSFHPFTIRATGLDLWTYLGGAWRHERTYPFSC